MQQLDRHRIEHLVADDDAAQRRRQRVGPDGVSPCPQALALARAQRPDKSTIVATHGAAELVEQLRRELARAGAELPDLVGAAGIERLAKLPGERLAEQRREFRRGDEVAAGAGIVPNLRLAFA